MTDTEKKYWVTLSNSCKMSETDNCWRVSLWKQGLAVLKDIASLSLYPCPFLPPLSGDQTTWLNSSPGWTANRRGDRNVVWVCAGLQPNNSICYGGWISHEAISASQNAASIFSQYKIPKLAGSQKRNRLEDIYIFLLADWEKTELPVWLQKGNTPQRKQYCNFTVPRKGTSATGAVLQGKAVSTKHSSHTSFVGSCLCKFPGSSGNFTAIKTTFFCL